MVENLVVGRIDREGASYNVFLTDLAPELQELVNAALTEHYPCGTCGSCAYIDSLLEAAGDVKRSVAQ